MEETRSSPTVSTKPQRIAEAARQHSERAFTTLAHHIDIAWLREAYRRTRKDGQGGELFRLYVGLLVVAFLIDTSTDTAHVIQIRRA